MELEPMEDRGIPNSSRSHETSRSLTWGETSSTAIHDILFMLHELTSYDARFLERMALRAFGLNTAQLNIEVSGQSYIYQKTQLFAGDMVFSRSPSS